MSKNFEKFKEKWELQYITLDALRKWVELHQKKSTIGISPEEFKEITGEDY